jgi:hypothetical protein
MRFPAVLVLWLALAATLATAASPRSQTSSGDAGSEHNYVCPHADGQPALECYFDAVAHLYTMCRNVKSIEIIEFGYENSRDGVNAAKSEYCLDKQKQNIARPYKAALREVSKSKPAVEGLQRLQETWLAAMTQLQWQSGESDGDYKARVARPYEAFDAGIASVRTSVAAARTPPAVAKAATPKKSAKASKSTTQAKKH